MSSDTDTCNQWGSQCRHYRPPLHEQVGPWRLGQRVRKWASYSTKSRPKGYEMRGTITAVTGRLDQRYWIEYDDGSRSVCKCVDAVGTWAPLVLGPACGSKEKTDDGE